LFCFAQGEKVQLELAVNHNTHGIQMQVLLALYQKNQKEIILMM